MGSILETLPPTGAGRARGLVSSPKSGSRIEATSYAPAEDLRDVVSAYWSGRWDLRGQPPHTTELLGDPCVHFVFERGGEEAGSRLVGVWTRLWQRKLRDRGRVRGVKLRAGALRAFVEAPAHRFRNRIVPLEAVFAPDALTIGRAILDPDDDAEAFGACNAWLRTRRRDDPQTPLAVAIAERIAADRSVHTVEQLAKVAGLSVRPLQRLFREHVGATPKWVIRRHRLQEAALRIEAGETGTLARLAAELGYTDQAHLARDFKSAVGKAPRDFAALVAADRV